MTPRQDDDSAPEVEFKQIEGLEQEIMISKGIISLKTDRATSYSKYIAVQNELARAFTELRDEMSMKQFKKPYNQLTEEEMKAINEAIPVRVSEAEPCEMN